MIWFYSDPHFSHARIAEFTGRPWPDVDDMNEALISRYNAVVQPTDTVHILGDVALGQIKDSLPLAGRLNGHKILYSGNHDRIFAGNKKSLEWFSEYEKYFDEIKFHGYMTIAGQKCELIHFPAKGDSQETDRYKAYRPEIEPDKWIVHGHTHQSEIYTEPRQISAGVDTDYTEYNVPRYTPISIDTIAQVIKDHT